MSVLEARALSKAYRGTYALNDCTLAIPAGTVTALVGPNGAGKSTLLDLAAGLRCPTAGNIRVLDGLVPGSPRALQGVGFVAQDAPLYRRMTVRGMLYMARDLNPPTWDGAYAVRRMVELGVPLNARVAELPGGHQTQLALAIALAKHPALLLLDEPLARLDPLARNEFLGVLMAEVVEGMSVILSTHVLAGLERTCDYLVLLSRGRVQLAGGVEELENGHQVLAGPPDLVASLPATLAAVPIVRAGAQAQVLVRTGHRDDLVPREFAVQPARLEQVVLAYLGEPDATALPGPQRGAAVWR